MPEKEKKTVKLEDLSLLDLLALSLPQEARKHTLRAKKEGLLAMKSLIDSTLKKLEEREEKTGEIREIEIE